MNVENENIEPVTDLGLALGYSSQCIQRTLNNNSGAGANAGSGLNMTFVPNNPLSELVWSPHKGLSLKCADSSFADTKTSLFWGAGPSNVALLPVQGITGRKSTTDKHLGGDNLFLSSNTSLQMASKVAGVTPAEHGPRREEDETGSGGDVEEINTAPGATVMHTDEKEETGDGKGVGVSGYVESQIAKTTETRENHFSTLPGQVNRKTTDFLSIKYNHDKPDEAQCEPSSADPLSGDRNDESSNYSTQMNFILTSEAHCVNVSEAPGDPNRNPIFRGRRNSLEKIESTSENDLQHLKYEYVCSVANDTVRLELSPEVKGSSPRAEDIRPTSKTVLDRHSPTNSRVLVKRREGKEKAFSDEMMPKDDDDSHESVESCNSAGLFPTGKRRRSFEEDLTVGTKGFKKQSRCADCSTSFARQDSSFMNWISNMMKGVSQSAQDEAAFPLSIVRADDGHEGPDKKIITINRNQDPGSKVIGFRSVFQSLYRAKEEGQQTQLLNVEYRVGIRSKELESSNKTIKNTAAPIACQGENSDFVGNQFLLLNERFNESTSGNGEGSAIQPKILLDKFADSQEKYDTNFEENKSKCQLVFSSKEKERTSSNSSLAKRKTNSTEQADSYLPSAGKTTSKFYNQNNSLGSIWITRFAAKIPSSSANPDHLKLIPHPQNQIGFHVDSTVFDAGDHSTDDPKSVYKLTPVLPFPKLNHSDETDSVFSRRLDSLKHITSLRVASGAAQMTMTCFFCGVKGHNLRDCSEIKQIELDELLRNLNTYSGREELPCLCIRCFQRSHWAVTCPKAPSCKHPQVESDASFNEMRPSTGNGETSKVQSGKDIQFQADISHKFCEREEMRREPGINSKAGEMLDFQEKLSSRSSGKNHVASSSAENASKENRIMPLSYFVNEQNPDVPKRLLDAVRSLRLCRSDVIKWKNSRMSLSQLDGFFLRLRLGKWEEGLGGTGYHVACIIGDDKSQDAKSSMLVRVGGIKCLVESRYISNHDFLEDELMAWWSLTARNGDKIPSEEELGLKVKTKKMLGF